MSYNDQGYDDYEHDRHADRYGQRRDHGRSDELFSGHDANRAAAEAMRKSISALEGAPVGKTRKFGPFELDEGLITMLSAGYNMASDYASQFVREKAFPLVERYGPKVGIPNQHIKAVAAGTAIASTIALKAGVYGSSIVDSHSDHRKKLSDLARRMAPVLDDIKGNHSLGALFSVKESDNEVIYAHRRRMNRIGNAASLENWITLGINSGANIMLDVKRFGAMWKDKANYSLEEIRQREHMRTLEEQRRAANGEVGGFNGGELLRNFSNMGMPGLARYVQRSNDYKLKHGLQPYSALEMIEELNVQVASKPDANGFQLPKSFQSPNGYREQYPLEEYIKQIFIQHQKDMADINPEHSEIRKALQEDLKAAVKPIAAAIRNGEMSALSLVRLVGEGKIIKKRGRAIATVDEAKKAVEHEAPNQKSYTEGDPAEHYKTAPYSKKQFKEALAALDKDERPVFASMFSDAMLADAGMDRKEIKKIRESTYKAYDRTIAELMLGANIEADEALKTKGLGDEEIQRLHEDSDKISKQGVRAVRQLRTGPSNPEGAERMIANLVVQEPKYLGKLLKDGREQFAKVAANDERTIEPAHSDKKVANGYTHREDMRRSQVEDFERGYD